MGRTRGWWWTRSPNDRAAGTALKELRGRGENLEIASLRVRGELNPIRQALTAA